MIQNVLLTQKLMILIYNNIDNKILTFKHNYYHKVKNKLKILKMNKN